MLSICIGNQSKKKAIIQNSTEMEEKMIMSILLKIMVTVCCIIVGRGIFKYPVSGSEKYQNELPPQNRYDLTQESFQLKDFEKVAS